MEFYEIEFVMKIFFIFSVTYENILESIRIFVIRSYEKSVIYWK